MKILTAIIALLCANQLSAQTDNKESHNNAPNLTYQIERLAFNSNGADFAPLIYKNGLLFCRNNRNDYWNNATQLAGNIDIYYTEETNGKYENPVKIKGEINTNIHEGQAVVSPNGRHLYFTQERRQEGKKTVWGIFDAEMLYGRWSNSKVFYHGFKQNNLAHPTLSADGNKLYFAADLPNGFGGMDIYVCERKGNFWGIPSNLGANINSKGDELFPYIHNDGTLYYASNGKDGLGGLDIFSSANQSGLWTEAQALPAPINSPKDDFSISFSQDNTFGYFSTTRNGNADIFRFKASKNNTTPILANKNELKTIAQKEAMPDNAQNKEQVILGAKTNLVANHNPIENKHASAVYNPIDYNKFDAENPILNAALGINPRFEAGSSVLLPETEKNLDKVATLLQSNPSLMIDIAAHTDSRGESNSNLILSTKRANAARNYLLLKNIASERISTHGYGEMRISNHCKDGINCPEEKHAENNRLEVYLSAGQLLASNVAAYNVHNAPIRGTATLPTYEVQVGPLKNVDTRTYYEYKQINPKVSFEDTPKGKVVIFGPYDTELQAKQESIKVSECTSQKANTVVKTSLKAITTPSNNALKDERNQFELFIGPYKHVTTDIYYKFTQLNVRTGIRYMPKGTMVVLGPFSSIQEAEAINEKLPKTLFSRKTNSAIYTDGGKTLLKLNKTKK